MRDKNEICDEKMKNEDEEESMEYESRKFMEASNVNENVTKWKSNPKNPLEGEPWEVRNGGFFKFEQKPMEKSKFKVWPKWLKNGQILN